MKKLAFIAAAMALFVFACRKNIDETTQREKGPIPEVNVESALIGRVLDASGAALKDAAVSVAGLSLTTNKDGLFFVSKKLLNSNGTYIKVTKNGYFDAVRFAYPQLNGTAQVNIQLMPKGAGTPFKAALGGKVDVGNGAYVELPADGLVTANGTPYSGGARMHAVWLDPSKSETFTLMPGDLRAIDTEGFAKILESYGMIGVELTTDAGAPLHLAPGKKAKISMPVPSSFKSSAPSSIPLWHFNTENGYWEEEGSATLTGDAYEGEVSHFSFWNCDVPRDYTKIKMTLVDADGDPLSGMKVILESLLNGYGEGFTDNLGQASGMIPANDELTMKVEDACGNIVYQTKVGPFSAETDLGNITITGLDAVEIIGKLQNCNGNPVDNGVALIKNGDKVLSASSVDANGEFKAHFINCAATTGVNITGYDFDALKQSAPKSVTLTGGQGNAGTIVVCDNLDQYVIVTTPSGTANYYLNTEFALNQGRLVATTILPSGPSDSLVIFASFSNVSPVTNTATLNYMYLSQYANGGITYYGCEYCLDQGCGCAPTDVTEFSFTQYPANIGDYAEGTIKANIQISGTINKVPITVKFRLKRTL